MKFVFFMCKFIFMLGIGTCASRETIAVIIYLFIYFIIYLFVYLFIRLFIYLFQVYLLQFLTFICDL